MYKKKSYVWKIFIIFKFQEKIQRKTYTVMSTVKTVITNLFVPVHGIALLLLINVIMKFKISSFDR